MGIVIDNSGSMRDKRANVNAASLALVKASNPYDEVFIIGFNDNAYLDQEFTSDTKLLEAALDKTESRGGTAMRDAIHLALDYMKGAQLKGAKRDKKVMLVITDGNDNTSDETLEQLVREARQSGVLIYSIGLLDEGDPGRSARGQTRPQGSGGGLGRPGLLSQESGRGGEDHAASGQGDPQSVPDRVYTVERRAGWHVSQDRGEVDRLREAQRALPQRLLCVGGRARQSQGAGSSAPASPAKTPAKSK